MTGQSLDTLDFLHRAAHKEESMKLKLAAMLAFLFVLAYHIPSAQADDYADETAAPATAAKEEAPADTVVVETTVKEEITTTTTTSATVDVSLPADISQPESPSPAQGEAIANVTATLAEQGLASNPPAEASVPNPYTNVSDPEFFLLQNLASELATVSKTGLDAAESNAHIGRYGEGNYIAMRKAFAEAAATLNDILHNSPIDLRKVHMTIKALKTIVVDLDDVFVYNPNYLNQLRNWNECKRILRRVDGTVYQEGGLRRLQTTIDSNQYMKNTGKFFNMNGFLGNLGDWLHRNNPTGPMDRLVGRYTGCRRVGTVWMLPSGTYQSSLTNARADMNEVVQQY